MWRALHNQTRQQLEQLQKTAYTDTRASLQETLTQREAALRQRMSEIASLQSDLRVIRAKRAEEVILIGELQHSKESSERELADLSRRLFDEAHQMIETERREKHQLQRAHEQSRHKLRRTESALVDVQEQLRALRKEIQSDVLEEFKNFAESLPTVSLRRLHSLEYMKQNLVEDIEPCLRFGSSPYTTSRKILESILARSCVLEALPEERKEQLGATTSLWDRFLQPSGCQACGRDVELTHQFRISSFDEWACIDRYCRDRLIAVLTFYDFLRRLRAGCYRHRSMDDIYQEYIRLKLQMSLSRQVP
ncbi:hypothetical protein DFQ28_006573 [Apophysomyces sp. BC1034]|nr:hypothetical protein DFQ30_007228 [Apophysomyces sp. BC1015]KAG0176952.1 hypothetical protein DFQ29_005433 [Apophysomyces sp. BC1021]KAG0187265.1 hypothetical protein DFQ28_006573 [Apophysomyces sp. BC1034]